VDLTDIVRSAVFDYAGMSQRIANLSMPVSEYSVPGESVEIILVAASRVSNTQYTGTVSRNGRLLSAIIEQDIHRRIFSANGIKVVTRES